MEPPVASGGGGVGPQRLAYLRKLSVHAKGGPLLVRYPGASAACRNQGEQSVPAATFEPLKSMSDPILESGLHPVNMGCSTSFIGVAL